jgi:predicted dehydrogenase
MVTRREVGFGVIGGGLMGKEFASATARWCHLIDLACKPKIVGVCDTNPSALDWFESNFDGLFTTANYQDLLARSDIEAIYCAVPHHLHGSLYCDIINAGKHLLGEKPFGIDLSANFQIQSTLRKNPRVLARCSSEFPFFPGAQRIIQFISERRFGRIIEIEAGFLHSSDLNPLKPINWKRNIGFNGAYGCLGDLGMHVVHIPLRFGWVPRDVRAVLSKIVPMRPDSRGQPVPCETWDNAVLLCEVSADGQRFPMTLTTKRISPGESNTWYIRITGTDFSAQYSTKYPKTVLTLPYEAGGPQDWHQSEVGYDSAYPTITGKLFEFGFSDAILQMWAAFLDELVHGQADMRQPFICATPDETELSHQIFTAALQSQRLGEVTLVGVHQLNA